MKNLRNAFSPVIIAIATAAALLWPHAAAHGQAFDFSQIPQGETAMGTFGGSGDGEGFYTQNSVYSNDKIWINGILVITTTKIWTPPQGEGISFFSKHYGSFYEQINTYYVITKPGHHLYRIHLASDANDHYYVSSSEEVTPPPNPFSSIKGDDLYAIMGDGSVQVTHNDTTWQVDTIGLNGAHAYDAALDSSQTVYLATSKGILKQALGAANPWQMLTSGFFQYISSTRDSRIFANGFTGLMMSTNLGATWTSDSAGLGMSPSTNVSITDDSAGTLYAITQDQFTGDHLWKQPRGGAWQPIGTGSILSGDPTARFIINDLLVDSGFYLATQYGEFYSGDGGATWTPIAQVPASNIYSFLELSNGRKVTTTDLGLFTKDPTDTSWTKRFPANSYESAIPLTEDNAGHLYALGSSRHKNGSFAFNPQNAPKDLYISTDHGTTWLPDTAGNTAVGSGIQFIDERGNQHLATNTKPPSLFFRALGGAWQGDSSGYTSKSGDGASAFASDRNGSLYLAITNSTNGNRLLKRPIASGTAWSEVTTNSSIGVPNVFTATKDGKLVGGNDSTALGYYDGTTWTVIPNPAGLTNVYGLPESVDSSGRLWVIFGNFVPNNGWTPTGTYWTSDLGSHWTEAAGDSLNFGAMASFGDTTYGLNSGKGLYYFVPGSAGVSQAISPNNAFSIMPNPSTGKGEISFTMSERNMIQATIFNVLGQEIASPIQGTFDEGTHTGSFDLSSFAPGTYYCRIESAGMVETQKLVIEH